jgi:uncharacterized protein YidB (DUF937 family)
MGLLDGVLGMAAQALGQGQTVGGASPDLLQAALGMLSNEGPAGGLSGLVQAFQQGGMGNVVQSWIGTGQNLPISADQLQAVLGSDTVAQIAQRVGLDPSQLTAQLAQVLPGMVDKLTPDGQAPAAGLGSLADLASQFLGARAQG